MYRGNLDLPGKSRKIFLSDRSGYPNPKETRKVEFYRTLSNSIELYRTLSNQLYPPLAQRKRTVNGLDFSSSTEELARELEIRAGYLSKVMPTVASHLNEHK